MDKPDSSAKQDTACPQRGGVTGPVLYCGDPHGRFHHIIEAAGSNKASAVVLLGDLEPKRPLHVELEPLLARNMPVYFIHGNHDADSDEIWTRVWSSEVANRNVHGQVVELPNGQRLAGLGGVFRDAVWSPNSSATRRSVPWYRNRDEHGRRTPPPDQWGPDGPERKHWGTIYPDEVDALADLRADILVTHEAPGYHPGGFELLDTLAQSMGVGVVVHGHHHDSIDSSSRWAAQGFKTYGVGLRGITAIDESGVATIVVPGEEDQARSYRQAWFDAFEGSKCRGST